MLDPLLTGVSFMPLRLSRNRIEHLIDPFNPDLTDRTGLQYFLEVQAPDTPLSPTLEVLTTLQAREKPARQVGNTTLLEGAAFGIDVLLDGLLERQKPVAGQDGMSVVASLTTPYGLREWVVQEGVSQLPASTQQPQLWVLKAGIDAADMAAWGETFVQRYIGEGRRFLTWQPDDKWVSARQEEYLYWLNNLSPTPSEVRLRVELTRQDGSVTTRTQQALTGLMLNNVVCVPVGPLALKLAAETSPVVRYRVWLSDAQNWRLTEARTYRVDRRYRQQERHVLLANSLGGYDTLRLVGDGRQTLKVDRTTAQMNRPAGSPPDVPELQVVYINGQREITVSTGYVERSVVYSLRYLDELLLSPDLYLITDRGHVPVTLSTRELVDVQDGADMVAREFTFLTSDAIQNFSALPAALPPQRPIGWAGQGVVLLLDAYGKRTGFGRPLKLRKIYLDDGSTYRPLTEKPNVPGDPDYVAQIPLVGIPPGSTPFPSVAISREGRYARANCPTGQTGGPATISIPAGRYGAETAGVADQRAQAEAASLDTQAYANANGTCSLTPYNYFANVAAGRWRYRSNRPDLIGLYNDVPPGLSNAWHLEAGSNLFPMGTNDRDVPLTGDPTRWRLTLHRDNPPALSQTINVYRNGALVASQVLPYNANLNFRPFTASGPAQLQSQDRVYIEVV